MTIIASISTNDSLYIGYNNGSVLGGTPVIGTSNPWIFFGDWALGITGESSVQRLLEMELNNIDNSEKSASEIINTISDVLTENDIGSKSEEEYVKTFGIYAILANKDGRIWDVSGCLSLTEIPVGSFWAQGSGADYAMGAYYAIEKLNSTLGIKERIALCIDAAIFNDVHSAGSSEIRVLRSDQKTH
jgi:ATP-dependent protease HslVU (ClpYQ) peptidase subunit